MHRLKVSNPSRRKNALSFPVGVGPLDHFSDGGNDAARTAQDDHQTFLKRQVFGVGEALRGRVRGDGATPASVSYLRPTRPKRGNTTEIINGVEK